MGKFFVWGSSVRKHSVCEKRNKTYWSERPLRCRRNFIFSFQFIAKLLEESSWHTNVARRRRIHRDEQRKERWERGATAFIRNPKSPRGTHRPAHTPETNQGARSTQFGFYGYMPHIDNIKYPSLKLAYHIEAWRSKLKTYPKVICLPENVKNSFNPLPKTSPLLQSTGKENEAFPLSGLAYFCIGPP